MTTRPDYALTFVLLLPIAALGVVAVIAARRSRPRRRRRLSNAEVRRMYRITAERAGKYQGN